MLFCVLYSDPVYGSMWANAGKPWGRVQLHQGGQECIRKDHFFGEIAPKTGTPVFDTS